MKILLIGLFVAVLLAGCSDSQVVTCSSCGGPPYRSLADRDDVLFNLELAYNESNLDEFTRLLDDNFVFHFSDSDVQNGNVPVAQWNGPDELAATDNLFNGGNLPPGLPPASKIDLTLYFTDGDDDWQAVAPPDPQQYPNETWYVQRIGYSLTVSAGFNTYTTGNPFVTEFTIRPVDDNGTTVWRIVSWTDASDVPLLRREQTDAAARAFIDGTTWGAVKELFAPKKKDQ